MFKRRLKMRQSRIISFFAALMTLPVLASCTGPLPIVSATDIIPNKVPEDFLDKHLYLGTVDDVYFFPTSTTDYEVFKDQYLRFMEADGRAEAIRSRDMSGPTYINDSSFSLNDEFIRVLFEEDLRLRRVDKDGLRRNDVLLRTVSLYEAGPCLKLVTRKEDDTGRLRDSDDHIFAKIASVKDEKYILSISEQCTERGDAGKFEIYAIEKTSEDKIELFMPPADENSNFLDDEIAELNVLERAFFGVTPITMQQLSSVDATTLHDIAFTSGSDHSSSQLNTQISKNPRFYNRLFTGDHEVFGIETGITIRLANEESVIDAIAESNERLGMTLKSLKKKAILEAEKEREAEKAREAAERSRREALERAAAEQQRKADDARRGQTYQNFLSVASSNNYDLFIVSRNGIGEISGVGTSKRGPLLFQKSYSAVLFDHVDVAGNSNPNRLKDGERGVYWEHLGGNSYRSVELYRSGRRSRCDGSWVDNGGTLEVAYSDEMSRSGSVFSPAWTVAPRGRVCKTKIINTDTCEFARCHEVERNPRTSYIVVGRQNALQLFEQIEDPVFTPSHGKSVTY